MCYHILNWKGAIILSRSEKIVQSVKELVEEMPPDQITYAAIADKANVHWTTVRNTWAVRKICVRYQSARKRIRQTNQDTRERVMDAAIQVFAQHGYAGATMAKVRKKRDRRKASFTGILRTSVIYIWRTANVMKTTSATSCLVKLRRSCNLRIVLRRCHNGFIRSWRNVW